MLIGALALGACGGKTKAELDAKDLPRTAAEFVAVYNDWDGDRLAALYNKSPDLVKEQAKLAWLHDRLGDCGAPELMWQLKLKRARFAAQCERGELEFFMRLDGKGRLVETLNGAVGVETPAPVAKALRDVVAVMPWTKAGAGQFEWSKTIKSKWARKLGRCEITNVRSVTDSTARVDLRCDNGAALLKVVLNEDGTINRVGLWRSDDDKTRAFKQEVMG